MIEYLPLVLTGLGLTASIVYYAGVLRNANKTQKQQLETRQAQLFMNIYSYVYTMEFWTYYRELTEQWEWEDYDDWYKKYRSDTDTYNKFAVVGTYFEGMGVLVKRNLIEITFVDDLMSGPIMQFWQKFEPIILEERRRRNMPTIWEWFEYLYDRVKEVSEREHGARHVVDVERLSRRHTSN